jgi:hypothetical protein
MNLFILFGMLFLMNNIKESTQQDKFFKNTVNFDFYLPKTLSLNENYFLLKLLHVLEN